MESQRNGLREWSVVVGYVVGLSLILAAIIYFFASNWHGFSRHAKIGLSVSLCVGFYFLAILFSNWFHKRPFLGRLLLVGGCVTFGATLSLLGQIYNSHADSYLLFLIWLIPACLLGLITKYQPFFVLSYLLIQLTAWFYLFPSFVDYFDHYWISRCFLIAIALVNFILYWLIERGGFQGRAPTLGVISLIVSQIAMLLLSSGGWQDIFAWVMSAVYIGLLIFWYRYNLKRNATHVSFFMGGAIIVFFLIKFFSFLNFVGSEYVYLFTILLPVVVVGVGWWLAQRKGSQTGDTQSKNNIQILPIIVVTLASIIAASSIGGILFGVIGVVPYYVAYLLAFVLIVPGVLVKQWNLLVADTFVLTGMLLGVPSSMFMNPTYPILILAVVLVGFLLMARSQWLRVITYPLILVLIISFLLRDSLATNWVMLIPVLINGCVFALSRLMPTKFASFLTYQSYFYGLLLLFIWTFFSQHVSFVYYLINSVFFIITTGTMLFVLKKDRRLFQLTCLFWFSFIIYKYYDTLWTLLNKSLTFALLGCIIFLVAFFSDRNSPDDIKTAPILYKKWTLILAVLILQLGFIGWQVGHSEYLLSHGETIKLKVVPVDPRSILQGDYLQLTYDISSVHLAKSPKMNQKVSIPLVKTNQGFYKYSPTSSSSKAVYINGRYKGNNQVVYGIEDYFIAEKSKLNQYTVHYAYVKVSKNGNAILLSVK